MKEEHQNLAQWLQRLDQGELSEWMGWSPTWKMEDILEVWKPTGEPQRQQLHSQAFMVYDFSLPHQSQPAQVYADDQARVKLLRLEDAVLAQSAAELELLWGVPAAKMELPGDHRFAPAQLWVFPERGISLYVLAPDSHGALSLSAISLYVPTTLEVFLHEIDGDERVRMWED